MTISDGRFRSRRAQNRRVYLHPLGRGDANAATSGPRLEEMTMESDGNCLFRAVSDQVYHTPEHHQLIRQRCMDYIRAERDFFQQYLTENVDEYCDRKAQDGEWGDDIEIQAMGEIYQTKIEIYSYNGVMLRTFHEDQEHGDASIMNNVAGPSNTNNDNEEHIAWSDHDGHDSSDSSASEEDRERMRMSYNGMRTYYAQSEDQQQQVLRNTPGRRNNGSNFRIRLMYRGSNHYNSLRVKRVRRLTREILARIWESMSPAIRERREPGELEEIALQRRRNRPNPVQMIQNEHDNLTSVLERSRGTFQAQKDRELDEILKLSLEEENVRLEREVLKRSLEENWKGATSSSSCVPTKKNDPAEDSDENELLRAALALSLEGKEPVPNEEERFLNSFQAQNEYPESVLMCVSMGFPIADCVKAQQFVGDDTEAMLAFLTSNV